MESARSSETSRTQAEYLGIAERAHYSRTPSAFFIKPLAEPACAPYALLLSRGFPTHRIRSTTEVLPFQKEYPHGTFDFASRRRPMWRSFYGSSLGHSGRRAGQTQRLVADPTFARGPQRSLGHRRLPLRPRRRPLRSRLPARLCASTSRRPECASPVHRQTSPDVA